ncbi:MAG: ABC-three component system protein [Christiangramia sp.]|nr:ABC-three component system protein [Christiangramia sp.]
MIHELPSITNKKRVSTLDILNGKKHPPLKILSIFSPDDFEEMTLEWATSFLKGKYKKVQWTGGAGDLGRDIIGYYESGEIDVYQCKHYGKVISPSDIYLELGKLCYYTFNNNRYRIPKTYYIVSSKGIGPSLLLLLENPKEINEKLIEKWDDKCQDKITKKESVILQGNFLEYVKNFDFSIVTDKPPLQLIEEYRQTPYYPSRFGGGLINARQPAPVVESGVQDKELIYTEQLFKVYTEKTSEIIKEEGDVPKAGDKIVNHFKEQRESFFCAESLEKFSRDNFTDVDILPFDELKADAFDIISTNLNINEDESGWKRLETSVQELNRESFQSNALHYEIRMADKRGLGHYLANEGKVKWIEDEE